MKKLIYVLIFLAVSSFSYGANVYFIVVNNGDVSDGEVYYSLCTIGAAPMSYTIAPVSNYFVSVEDYGARIKYPDGYWGSWQNNRQGGWTLPIAGTYQIQGRVKVLMDRRGEGNYWMYWVCSLKCVKKELTCNKKGKTHEIIRRTV